MSKPSYSTHMGLIFLHLLVSASVLAMPVVLPNTAQEFSGLYQSFNHYPLQVHPDDPIELARQMDTPQHNQGFLGRWIASDHHPDPNRLPYTDTTETIKPTSPKREEEAEGINKSAPAEALKVGSKYGRHHPALFKFAERVIEKKGAKFFHPNSRHNARSRIVKNLTPEELRKIVNGGEVVDQLVAEKSQKQIRVSRLLLFCLVSEFTL